MHARASELGRAARGISLALALGLPGALHPYLLVPMTFVVVLFSAVEQGLTLKPLLRWLAASWLSSTR